MPTYRHPLADSETGGQPPARIHVTRANKATVDDDGTFDVPEHVAERIADRFGTTLDAMAVDGGAGDGDTETCQVTKADGEICGRELPCPYHSEDDDE